MKYLLSFLAVLAVCLGLSGQTTYKGNFIGNGAGLTNITANFASNVASGIFVTNATILAGAGTVPLIVDGVSGQPVATFFNAGANEAQLDQNADFILTGGHFQGLGTGLSGIPATAVIGTAVTNNSTNVTLNQFVVGSTPTFYMSPSGSDANSGLTAAASFQSAAMASTAISNAGGAGVIIMEPGTNTYSNWFNTAGWKSGGVTITKDPNTYGRCVSINTNYFISGPWTNLSGTVFSTAVTPNALNMWTGYGPTNSSGYASFLFQSNVTEGVWALGDGSPSISSSYYSTNRLDWARLRAATNSPATLASGQWCITNNILYVNPYGGSSSGLVVAPPCTNISFIAQGINPCSVTCLGLENYFFDFGFDAGGGSLHCTGCRSYGDIYGFSSSNTFGGALMAQQFVHLNNCVCSAVIQESFTFGNGGLQASNQVAIVTLENCISHDCMRHGFTTHPGANTIWNNCMALYGSGPATYGSADGFAIAGNSTMINCQSVSNSIGINMAYGVASSPTMLTTFDVKSIGDTECGIAPYSDNFSIVSHNDRIICTNCLIFTFLSTYTNATIDLYGLDVGTGSAQVIGGPKGIAITYHTNNPVTPYSALTVSNLAATNINLTGSLSGTGSISPTLLPSTFTNLTVIGSSTSIPGLTISSSKNSVSTNSYLLLYSNANGSQLTTLGWVDLYGNTVLSNGSYITMNGGFQGNGAGLTNTFNGSTNVSIIGGTTGVTNTSTKYGTCVVTSSAGTYSNFDGGGNFLYTNANLTGTEAFPVGPGAGVKSIGAGITTSRIIFQ